MNKLANVQAQLERLVERNYYLHRAARDAYRSYIQAYVPIHIYFLSLPLCLHACLSLSVFSYASHSLRDTFNVGDLDLAQVAKSFGFSSPPMVSLSLTGTYLKHIHVVAFTWNAKKKKTFYFQTPCSN